MTTMDRRGAPQQAERLDDPDPEGGEERPVEVPEPPRSRPR